MQEADRQLLDETFTLDEKLEVLIEGMRRQLGRLPSDDEVMAFIFGDEAKRDDIWNAEVTDGETRTTVSSLSSTTDP